MNEPSIYVRNSITSPIPDELKIKLEKLMRRRSGSLALVLSERPSNQESQELMVSMDAIISLTEAYVD